jgi:hypothetical protein
MKAQLPIPTPAFTVARALDWLGHDCAQHCSSALDELPAAIWFVSRANHGQRRGTIVVVDPSGSDESIVRIRRDIRDVNRCTRGERIYVLGRRMADIDHALSIVTREPIAPSHCHLVGQNPAGVNWIVGGSPDSLTDRRRRAALEQVPDASLRRRQVGLAPRG